MPRPQNKEELLQKGEVNFQTLIDFVDTLENYRENEFPPGPLNRNVRDVYAHLHHWHLMLLGWYKEGVADRKPHVPAEGYTWKTLPELNRKINVKYAFTDFEEVFQNLKTSHAEMMALIARHNNEELFTKKRYAWTGSTSLAAYLISATSSHYDWAYKLIKKASK